MRKESAGFLCFLSYIQDISIKQVKVNFSTLNLMLVLCIQSVFNKKGYLSYVFSLLF